MSGRVTIDIKMAFYNGKSYPIKQVFGTVAQSQTDAGIINPGPGVGKKIVTVGGVFMATTAATNFVLNTKGAGAGVAVGMTVPAGANGGLNLAQTLPWSECNEAEALTCSTGAGGNVNYQIPYIIVDVK